MKKLRTIVIIIGIAVTFTFIAALAIIIARGDKLTNEGRLIQTGIIKIESKPADVSVFVNGEEVRLQDRQIIGLESGEYEIILKKDGYTDWEKKVEARVGSIVEIYAQLFPTSLNLNEVTKTNIDRVFYSQKGDWAIYTVKSSEFGSDIGLWRVRLSKPTITIVENKAVKLSNLNPLLKKILESNYDIELSPDSRLLKIHNLDSNEYFILDAELYNEPDKSLNSSLGFDPDEVHWFRESSSLVIVKDDIVFEYELDTSKSTIVSLTPGEKPVIAVNKDRVIFYNQNKDRLEIYERGKSEPLNVQNINLPSGIKSLYVTKNDHKYIIFETEQGFFYLNTEKGFLDKIGENIELLEFSPDGQSALIAKDNKLYSYAVRQFIAENRFEAKTSLIKESFDPINERVKWSPDSIHIILTQITPDERSITLYDRDGSNMKEILNDQRIANSDVFVSSESSLLYTLMSDELKGNDTDGAIIRKNLYEIDLVRPLK